MTENTRSPQRLRRHSRLAVVATGLVTALFLTSGVLAAPGGGRVPEFGDGKPAKAAGAGEGRPKGSGKPIKDEFIVTLNDGVDPQDVARDYRGQSGAVVDGVFRRVVRGFAGTFPPGIVKKLQRDDRVAAVEPNVTATVSSHTTVPTSPYAWGVDRLDQRDWTWPGDLTYNHTASGAGVRIYVLDTGVRSTHQEFLRVPGDLSSGSRVVSGYTYYNDAHGTGDCAHPTTASQSGHGTHVAGIAAGFRFGVAYEATVVPVRVMDCDGSGTTTSIMAGIEWMLANHPPGVPAVANLSLGVDGGHSGLDDAVRTAISRGITLVAAAGNSAVNSCYQSDVAPGVSPARVVEAITVGASTLTNSNTTDTAATFSNFGACLDLYAPGQSISAARWDNDTTTMNKQGTSMAAPFVAGVAALRLEKDLRLSASPASVQQAIVDTASTGKLQTVGAGSPNRLLHSIFPAAAPRTGAPTQGVVHTEHVAATDFQPVDSATQFATANGCINPTGAAGVFTADLQVPHGALLEQVTMRFNDTVAEDSSVKLVRASSAFPPNPTAVVTTASSGTGGHGSASVAGGGVALGTVGGALYLEWTSGGFGGGSALCGVEVQYRLPQSPAGFVFTPVKPCPVFDTRVGFGGRLTPILGGTRHSAFVTGNDLSSQGGSASGCGIPADATAVTLNLGPIPATAGGNGNVRMWSTADARPDGSVVGFSNGGGDSSAVTVGMDSSNAVGDILIEATGSPVHLRGVVLGYYSRGAEREAN